MADQRPDADYERGYLDGLTEAARLVTSAPVLLHGQRRADVPGGVPRIMDSAVDDDGDPNYVHNSYALRDAVLHWLQKRAALIDGSSASNGPSSASEAK